MLIISIAIIIRSDRISIDNKMKSSWKRKKKKKERRNEHKNINIDDADNNDNHNNDKMGAIEWLGKFATPMFSKSLYSNWICFVGHRVALAFGEVRLFENRLLCSLGYYKSRLSSLLLVSTKRMRFPAGMSMLDSKGHCCGWWTNDGQPWVGDWMELAKISLMTTQITLSWKTPHFVSSTRLHANQMEARPSWTPVISWPAMPGTFSILRATRKHASVMMKRASSRTSARDLNWISLRQSSRKNSTSLILPAEKSLISFGWLLELRMLISLSRSWRRILLSPHTMHPQAIHQHPPCPLRLCRQQREQQLRKWPLEEFRTFGASYIQGDDPLCLNALGPTTETIVWHIQMWKIVVLYRFDLFNVSGWVYLIQQRLFPS